MRVLGVQLTDQRKDSAGLVAIHWLFFSGSARVEQIAAGTHELGIALFWAPAARLLALASSNAPPQPLKPTGKGVGDGSAVNVAGVETKRMQTFVSVSSQGYHFDVFRS